jgi:hypothetical protein
MIGQEVVAVTIDQPPPSCNSFFAACCGGVLQTGLSPSGACLTDSIGRLLCPDILSSRALFVTSALPSAHLGILLAVASGYQPGAELRPLLA